MLHFIKQLWDTLRIDTLALIPHSSHEPLYPSVLLEYADKTKLGVSQWIHLWLFVKNMLRAFRDRGPVIPRTPAGEVFFLAMSKNQEHSLRPIKDRLSKDVAARLWSRQSLQRLWMYGYLVAIPFLPLMLWRWLVSRGYERRSFEWSMDQYWLNFGLYLVCRLWLCQARPHAVVVANDHSQISCVLVAAAHAEGIKTFYVQHACVTPSFPALRTDYALLDGRDAVGKYDRIGTSDTKVFTIGITKFDGNADRIRSSNKLRQVGVCFNKADELKRCIEMLDRMHQFAAELDFVVVVRPHPRMTGGSLSVIEAHASKLGLTWSDPHSESPFDFLCAQDVILCGMSAIALEAALVNVVPINFVMSDDFTDWYGFAERGLCRSTACYDELKEWLVEVKEGLQVSIRAQAKFYSATVDTSWDDRSGELAATIIQWQEFDGKPVPVQRISTEQLEAYEPMA